MSVDGTECVAQNKMNEKKPYFRYTFHRQYNIIVVVVVVCIRPMNLFGSSVQIHIFFSICASTMILKYRLRAIYTM